MNRDAIGRETGPIKRVSEYTLALAASLGIDPADHPAEILDIASAIRMIQRDALRAAASIARRYGAGAHAAPRWSGVVQTVADGIALEIEATELT